MSYRLRVLVTMAALVTTATAAELVGMDRVMRRELDRRMSSEVDALAALLHMHLDQDLRRLDAEARVVAGEPRLKAVAGTADLGAATVADVLEELRRSAGWDLLLLTDSDGRARSGPPGSPAPKLVAAALAGRPASGFWVRDGRLYLAAAHPVAFEGPPVGVVVAGVELSDARLAELLPRGAGSAAIWVDGALRASSAPAGVRDALGALDPFRAPPVLTVAGEAFEVRRLDLGAGRVGLVLYSRDAALAPLARLRGAGLAVAGLAMLIALAVSFGLARGVSKPVAALTGWARQVRAGSLGARVAPTGNRELATLGDTLNEMIEEVSRSREELRRAEAARRELEIAREIQLGMLPGAAALAGFQLSALVRPATAVGGDFYELQATPGGFALVVGDVSGHGLKAGLVMLLAQAAAQAAALGDDPSPQRIVEAVNRMIYQNVRERMGRDDYVTLMAACHQGGGAFRSAGSHQPIFLRRAAGTVEVVWPEGPWCGLAATVGDGLVEQAFSLASGDTACFISDGVIEARGQSGELYGTERLADSLSRLGDGPPAEALPRLVGEIDAFMAEQEDDLTLILLRRD